MATKRIRDAVPAESTPAEATRETIPAPEPAPDHDRAERIRAGAHYLQNLLDCSGNLKSAAAPTNYKHRHGGMHHAGPDHPASGRHASFGDAWTHTSTDRTDPTTLRDFLVAAGNHLHARGERVRGDVCLRMAAELA